MLSSDWVAWDQHTSLLGEALPQGLPVGTPPNEGRSARLQSHSRLWWGHLPDWRPPLGHSVLPTRLPGCLECGSVFLLDTWAGHLRQDDNSALSVLTLRTCHQANTDAGEPDRPRWSLPSSQPLHSWPQASSAPQASPTEQGSAI